MSSVKRKSSDNFVHKTTLVKALVLLGYLQILLSVKHKDLLLALLNTHKQFWTWEWEKKARPV